MSLIFKSTRRPTRYDFNFRLRIASRNVVFPSEYMRAAASTPTARTAESGTTFCGVITFPLVAAMCRMVALDNRRVYNYISYRKATKGVVMKKHTITYDYHDVAQAVVDWLNSPRASKHPVATLFDSVVRAMKIATTKQGTREAESRALRAWERGYNRLSRKHPWGRRLLLFRSAGSGVGRWVFLLGRQSRARGARAREVAHMLDHLDNLEMRGELWRIRRCELESCGRFFIARVRHQRFDDRKCKRKHMTSTPKFKQTRAVYQKKYYRDNLSSTARGKA